MHRCPWQQSGWLKLVQDRRSSSLVVSEYPCLSSSYNTTNIGYLLQYEETWSILKSFLKILIFWRVSFGTSVRSSDSMPQNSGSNLDRKALQRIESKDRLRSAVKRQARGSCGCIWNQNRADLCISQWAVAREDHKRQRLGKMSARSRSAGNRAGSEAFSRGRRGRLVFPQFLKKFV